MAAPPAPRPDYLYVAVPLRVIDGDTIEVAVDLGFKASITTPVRLFGVNAPEKSTASGHIAAQWTQRWLDSHDAWRLGLTIRSVHPGAYGDKYGRWLARVWASSGAELNQELLASGNAVPFLV